MSEESNFYYFGTPLPALEKPDGSVVPAKRHPLRPEDQIVTDENGKRRFHGAFTGGFSAGFWNTVGSQEGWTPQTFKSSRSEKAPQRQQLRPEDFMDDEDLGEFGIAPKKVQVRPEFAVEADASEREGNERKRKLQQPNIGPIPGQPVLCQLLKNADVQSVAVRILRLWGWRPGRGVGPRQTRKQKLQARERNKREMYVLERYGCDAEAQARKPIGYDDGSDEDMHDSANSHEEESEDDGITYAPEDFEPRPAVKENSYGLGYTPLSRDAVLAQDILAHPKRTPQVFEVVDKNNVKFSITGQAFGVGALEDDDDEEVYHREDWTKYDFSLEEEQQKRKESQKKVAQDNTVLDGFVLAKRDHIYKPFIYKVSLPPDFRPRNWAERRSRFEPLDPQRQPNLPPERRDTHKRPQRSDTDMTPEQRGRLLGEQPATPTAVTDVPSTSARAQQQSELRRQRDEQTKALLERITKGSNFTKGGIITADGEEQSASSNDTVALQKERDALLERAQNKTKHLPTDMTSGSFKPFVNDDAKQRRYEQFLDAKLKTEDEISAFLRDIQPVHLSEWDREMEKKEFIQARSIYKPLGGIMSDRFVSEAAIDAEKKTVVEEHKPDGAAKIIMQRTSSMWKPSALLCKRYNIAEPYGGALPDEKKPHKAKLSIFDYLETSVNKKADFHTPVIIPKHIEKPKAIVRETVVVSADPPTATTPTPIAPTPSTVVEVAPVKTKGFVARTELQKRVVESIDKPASDKLELFKAIFDDSDDEGEIDTNAAENDSTTQAEETPLPPSIAQPKSAAAANLLRNTSPPRGIFAALFNADHIQPPLPPTVPEAAAKTNDAGATAAAEAESRPKIAFKPRNERLPKESTDSTTITAEPPDAAVYGPKLPDRPPPTQSEDVEAKILQLLNKHKQQAVATVNTQQQQVAKDDEWVERKLAGRESESSDSESDSSTASSSSSSGGATGDKRKRKKTKQKQKLVKKLKKHKSKDCHKKHHGKRDKKSHKSKKASHKSKKSKKSTK